MTQHHNDNSSQEARLRTLHAELGKLGGSVTVIGSTTSDVEEEFLRHILEYETAQQVSLLQLIQGSGLEIPLPETLDQETLSQTLYSLIERMAASGFYLLHTNHLSDRELYDFLCHNVLREVMVPNSQVAGSACLIDLTGNGTDEENQIFLKYYADEGYRQKWSNDWPDDHMPEHEAPAYDRDGFLPQFR